jgi:hypothetical protein
MEILLITKKKKICILLLTGKPGSLEFDVPLGGRRLMLRWKQQRCCSE